MTKFDTLGLAAPLLKALAAEGYEYPTPIQIQAIPPVLAGRDLVGLAQTGTGKTAAFALPILHRLNANQVRPQRGACRALVLAPTRELAAQIGASFRSYGRFVGLNSTVVFGGVPIGKQIKALDRGVDILVATPGRLLDLISQRACRLDGVEVLVLDEADHMMDLGFIVPLKKIAKMLPKARQTLFFSATMPQEIEALSLDFINEPVRVAVATVSATAERVTQSVIHVNQANKPGLLQSLLADKAMSRTLVFSRTKHGANRIADRLDEIGIAAAAIHGNKSQSQREKALYAFKRGELRVLVATDIAARGVDIDNVTHVINYDLPDVPEQYVHRIGRTARAGNEGDAISFCAPDERGNLRDIEKVTKQTVPVVRHELAMAAPRADERSAERPRPQRQGQRSGQRDGQRDGQRNGDRSNGQRSEHRSDQRQDRRPSQRSEGQRSEGRPEGQRSERKRSDTWSNQGGEQRSWSPMEQRAEHRSEPRSEHRGGHQHTDHHRSDQRAADHRSGPNKPAAHNRAGKPSHHRSAGPQGPNTGASRSQRFGKSRSAPRPRAS